MKPDSPFNKLPSLAELLGHPAVAQVVKRVNQSTIAQRATGFLDELQNNLRQRWEQGHVPSLGQLAERFARRLLGPAQTSVPAVNATGTLLGKPWHYLPLAEAAVNEVVRLATEYHNSNSALADRVHSSLRDLTGADAALVVNNYRAATEIVRNRNVRIELARFAGLLNPSEQGLSPYDTLPNRVQNGGELIVADGAGLLGGPPCGIILGKRDLVESVSHDSIASVTTPDDLTLAALAATLGIYEKGEQVIHQIPIWQLLTTPLENLEQRANRLATLIAATDNVETSAPMSCDSVWCDDEQNKLSGPTWVISVKPRKDSLEALREALESATPQVTARVQEEEIWLDLRGVFPRWDQHLVSACG